MKSASTASYRFSLCWRCGLSLCLSLWPCLEAVSDELSVGLSTHSIDYREYGTDGEHLINEQGSLHGVSLGYRLPIAANTFVVAAYGLREGELAYSGQTQAGVPLVTSTHVSEGTVQLLAQSLWDWGSGGVAVQFGGESVTWDRHIRSTPSTSEVRVHYRWLQWLAGIDGQLRLTQKLSAVVGYSYLWHESGQVEVNLTASGLSALSLRTGSRKEHRLRGGFRWQVPDWQLELLAQRSEWDWQASEVGTITEPVLLSLQEPSSSQATWTVVLLLSRTL